MRPTKFALALTLAALAGCASHSPLSERAIARVNQAIADKATPTTSCRVGTNYGQQEPYSGSAASTEGFRPPRLVSGDQPNTPDDYEYGQRERVRVMATIKSNGRVGKTRIQDSTDIASNSAAVAAIRSWRFEPARLDGSPCEMRIVVPVSFFKKPRKLPRPPLLLKPCASVSSTTACRR